MDKCRIITLVCICLFVQNAVARGLWDRSEPISNPLPPNIVPEPSNALPVETRPQQRPDWMMITPEDEKVLYVVGKGILIDDESVARSDARAQGSVQVVEYILQQYPKEKRDTESAVSVKGLKQKQYYTEIYLDERGRRHYLVYALMAIDKKQLGELQKELGVEGDKQ